MLQPLSFHYNCTFKSTNLENMNNFCYWIYKLLLNPPLVPNFWRIVHIPHDLPRSTAHTRNRRKQVCAVYHNRYRIASRNSTFPDGTATLTGSLANHNTPTTTDAIGTQKQANGPNYWARYCVYSNIFVQAWPWAGTRAAPRWKHD